MQKFFYIIIIYLLINILFISSNVFAEHGEKGSKAPPVVLRDINGRLFFLSKLVGERTLKNKRKKAIVLSFFATWCQPCKEKIPILQSLEKKWKPLGIEILMVGFKEAQPPLEKFAKQFGLKLTLLVDKYGITAKRYGVKALPILFVVDGNGIIQKVIKGTHPNFKDILDNVFKDIIEDKVQTE